MLGIYAGAKSSGQNDGSGSAARRSFMCVSPSIPYFTVERQGACSVSEKTCSVKFAVPSLAHGTACSLNIGWSVAACTFCFGSSGHS